MTIRKQTGNRFVWIDLEMTGLDPKVDTILEIAAIVTDRDLNIIAQGPEIVINHPVSILSKMNEWCTTVHTESGLLSRVKNSDTSLLTAEMQILSFLREHCEPGQAPLGGNSVWMDRVFLMHHMPRLYDFLHYRTIDVSTIKELLKSWYPDELATQYKKNNSHRALEDIKESIDELRYYKNNFFIKL